MKTAFIEQSNHGYHDNTSFVRKAFYSLSNVLLLRETKEKLASTQWKILIS